MGLLVGLVRGLGLVGFCDGFLVGMWVLGLGSFFSRLIVFSSLGVEILSGFLWTRGLGVFLVIVRVWVGGVCYLCSNYWGVKDRRTFGLCVLLLSMICVVLFIVVG